MWKNITKALGTQEFQFNGPSSRIRFSLDDGNGIRFWEDEWIKGVVLKVTFPRIFVLSVNKLGKVKDFGFWRNNVWHWEISLRRRLFG